MPGDFSSAAPFIAAATLIPESRITIHDVNLNPRRTGLLDVLERMGGRVGILQRRRIGAEQVGDLEVRGAELTATTIHSSEVPLLVDELPLFALLASQARGESWVYGAGELRHRSRPDPSAVDALRAIGRRIKGHDEGFWSRACPSAQGRQGRRPRTPRIAMLGAVAGLASREGVEVQGAETVAISFPGFYDLLGQITRRASDLASDDE